MTIFSADWAAFLIAGLGTFFLIGEILINGRGIFAILGFVFITIYFYTYLETGSFVLMFIIYLTGLLLIIVDGKLLNDGTLATLGLAAMLFAVVLAAPDFNAGLYAVCGVLLGGGASFLLLRIFKKRNMWSKITLKDRLTEEAGYNSINAGYEALVGKEGVTLNDLRPVGNIRIEHKDFSAVSDGQWIPKDSRIRVLEVDGTKILVEKLKEKGNESF